MKWFLTLTLLVLNLAVVVGLLGEYFGRSWVIERART